MSNPFLSIIKGYSHHFYDKRQDHKKKAWQIHSKFYVTQEHSEMNHKGLFFDERRITLQKCDWTKGCDLMVAEQGVGGGTVTQQAVSAQLHLGIPIHHSFIWVQGNTSLE